MVGLRPVNQPGIVSWYWDSVDTPIDPSEDNTKAEIKAYMDDADVDYSSGDSKSELLDKLMKAPHSTPKIEEEYTYTDSVVDTTTLQDPTFKECAFHVVYIKCISVCMFLKNSKYNGCSGMNFSV